MNNIHRIDYKIDNLSYIDTFSIIDGHILHEHLDSNGALLDQELFKDGNIHVHIDALLNRIKCEAKTGVYETVYLKKSCPKCGNTSLNRYFDGKNVPIVPVYRCMNCSSNSIFITDEYLSKLVKNNGNLFDKKEIEELSKNNDYFMSELKEYIIRIFASKKILSIK